MGVYAKTALIPWDPSNEAHFKRMHDQRVACGWRYEEVEEWRSKMLKSKKFLYWINERFQLPSSTIWIMSLYISWALQSAGLGRSAMAETEKLARLPPFNRDIIGLDTVQKHFQLGDNNFNKIHYSSSGAEVRAIEEWYMRQGYEAVERVDRGYNWKDPLTGDVLPVPLVYMVKRFS
ncbi:hypothetical protein Neosp_014292 [[Neocosmospora] mangrovei]